MFSSSKSSSQSLSQKLAEQHEQQLQADKPNQIEQDIQQQEQRTNLLDTLEGGQQLAAGTGGSDAMQEIHKLYENAADDMLNTTLDLLRDARQQQQKK